MKPVAVIGSPGSVPRSWIHESKDLFAMTGLNTGNLAFQYAVYNQIASPKQVISFHFKPEEVKQSYSMICIPAANYLYHAFDFADFAERLERCNLPLLVVGLGMQAQFSIEEVTLRPGTERLLSLFAERCHTIAVRGDYTGQVLSQRGIKNFAVLGCPSNFINPHPDLGRRIAERHTHPHERFGFAPTFYPQNSAFEAVIAFELRGQLKQIVCQEPLSAVSLARGERSSNLVAWERQQSGFFGLLPPDMRDELLPLFRAYFSVEDWMESYQTLDMVLGSRIHGVALAWQAGRAACVVAHDLRTEELTKTMGLPIVRPEQIILGRVLGVVKDAIASAALGYDARRQALAARYCTVLTESGVEVSEELRSIAGGAAP